MSTSEAVESRAETLRLYLVTALIASITAAIWVTFVGSDSIEGAPIELHLWVLVVAYAATELVTVHIEARGEAHALTFSEIPTIVGLLTADPSTVLVARLVS